MNPVHDGLTRAAPQRDLSVTLVQPATVWEAPSANLAQLDRLLKGVRTDLIVLPETFSTGFSMNAEAIAELPGGQTTEWMQEKAKELNATITGSVVIKDGSHVFNRLLWVTPSGQRITYDKRHLFSLMDEQRAFSAGSSRCAVEVGGWKIRPLICYDLRFPVWCRNDDDYDALIFVANWPSARHLAWHTLLKARAIENQAYVIGVNRAGSDPQGIDFGGASLCVDPLGEVIEELGSSPSVISTSLSASRLKEVRSRYPFLRDRDSFHLI